MQKWRWSKTIHRQNDLPDEELVQRAQMDADQFSELYRRYIDEIGRFVRSRVSNASLAEDITSKVFLKAMQALPRYTDGPFRAWLYRIARNTIIDEYRLAKPTSDIADLPVADRAESLEDAAIRRDAAERLHKALDHLKPREREIVRLRLHGLSIAEISARMDMTPSAVKSAQRRAFITLRDVPGVAL